MEGGGRRSGESSGVVMKKRSSSGCLMVKKKGDGVGSIFPASGNRPVYDSWLENKRSRMAMSDSGSGSSDDIMIPRSYTAHQTMHHHCNGLSRIDRVSAEESDFGRRKDWAKLVQHKRDSFVRKSSEEWKERRMNSLDEVDYDDEPMTMRMQRSFDGNGVDIGRNAYLGSAQFGTDREYRTDSNRDLVLEKRRKSYFDEQGAVSFADQGCRNSFKVTADESEIHHASLLQKKYMGDTGFDGPIRVQGKNGVLKVMITKNNKMSGLLKNFTNMEAKQAQNTGKIRVAIHSPTTVKAENRTKLHQCVRIQSDASKMHTALTMKNKGLDQDSEDSDMSTRLQNKTIKAHKSAQTISGRDQTRSEEPVPPKVKDGKIRRGCGTEKQRLRERIRGMLLEAGWTIDYRPRKNRDYLDAVYINPTGTAYWSIIKAYEALLKQLNNGETEAKTSRRNSTLTLISDEILSQLTRKTKRKVENDLLRQQQGAGDSDEKDILVRKFSTISSGTGSKDRYVRKEKLSSSLGLGAMSMRNEVNHEAGLPGTKYKGDSHLHHQIERPAGSFSHNVGGGESVKSGRSTLLVRRSTMGNNSESDGFIPFSGKRTVLAWLIDNRIVQPSEKVIYMNHQHSRAILKGWITRDGIHCACCSKILSVSKFEIHAGSKLHQPFQNMYLDSGVSLLQCQIDAWDRQRRDGHIGFCSVDINADDPNDDACGICGDGGDLICCDGCPSTFHQRCLDIKMFPLGDWHCPNCTCKFCKAVFRDTTQTVDASLCKLLTCKMCEKKYHKSCMQEAIASPTSSTELGMGFCGKECIEIFEGLQKYVGIKHELEAGFSWSLLHRTETDSDSLESELPQTVESHSKLAVALTVMDECFLPIFDSRSGVNIIRNVLYNCGSNFNRLNFGGFYTAILERGDEIIASASIRFRGDRLAEMPFIGSRHVYRHQGMCRRLFDAIESALQCLKIEKLVIPATVEFSRVWTDKFGFRPVDHLLKQKTRSMNLLVFPGIDMLQKDLLGQNHSDEDPSVHTTDNEIKRDLYRDVRKDRQDGNEDMEDPMVKTSEVNVYRQASSSSSRSTTPSEDKPRSDSAVKRQLGSEVNSDCGLPTWTYTHIWPETVETEQKPSSTAVGSSCKDIESRRTEELPEKNCDMAFLDHIIRSPVDVGTKENGDLYCHNAGDSMSRARQ